MIHSSVMSSPSSVTVRLEPPIGGSAGTGDGDATVPGGGGLGAGGGGDASGALGGGGGGGAAGGGDAKTGGSLVAVSTRVVEPAQGSHVPPSSASSVGLTSATTAAVAAVARGGVRRRVPHGEHIDFKAGVVGQLGAFAQLVGGLVRRLAQPAVPALPLVGQLGGLQPAAGRGAGALRLARLGRYGRRRAGRKHHHGHARDGDPLHVPVDLRRV